jgi:hypothetical protein
MVDTSFWDKRRGMIHSRKGGWIIGEAIYNQGYSMMDDLVGKASWMQVLILNVTGRLPERRLADWIDAVFVCMSWPDSRIWCNQIGSFAGTMQAASVAGVSAGILATDSIMYGVAPLLEGTRFIREALVKEKNGLSTEEILKEHQLLQVPVATSPKGKGVFPKNHPLSFGVLGFAGNPAATEYIVNQEIDVMLAVGTSFNEMMTTDGTKNLPRANH